MSAVLPFPAGAGRDPARSGAVPGRPFARSATSAAGQGRAAPVPVFWAAFLPALFAPEKLGLAEILPLALLSSALWAGESLLRPSGSHPFARWLLAAACTVPLLLLWRLAPAAASAAVLALALGAAVRPLAARSPLRALIGILQLWLAVDAAAALIGTPPSLPLLLLAGALQLRMLSASWMRSASRGRRHPLAAWLATASGVVALVAHLRLLLPEAGPPSPAALVASALLGLWLLWQERAGSGPSSDRAERRRRERFPWLGWIVLALAAAVTRIATSQGPGLGGPLS